MDVPVKHSDAIAVPVIFPKLPTVTRDEWGMSLVTVNIPKLEDLLIFIERRANNISSTPRSVSIQHSSRRIASRTVKAHDASAKSASSASTTAADVTCPQCSGNHRLMKCQRFHNLQVQERWEVVKRLAVGFNCLRSGHTVRQCSSGVCSGCQQKHNTLLCRSADTTHMVSQVNTCASPSAPATAVSPTSSSNSHTVAPPSSAGPQVYSRNQ
ncbi:PREDICTED: uncharacterized protein LOC108362077 [Rhagoletis zephyria]|uniref:uncharacterized protein LOC108362077 n=1 Tax=Rhagoletis zephyria TaxID=28612 RepID=UPI000811417B|nr:PREDICTED: uncharacterized protein LOC108362077 [Rhagoletis zephyria]